VLTGFMCRGNGLQVVHTLSKGFRGLSSDLSEVGISASGVRQWPGLRCYAMNIRVTATGDTRAFCKHASDHIYIPPNAPEPSGWLQSILGLSQLLCGHFSEESSEKQVQRAGICDPWGVGTPPPSQARMAPLFDSPATSASPGPSGTAGWIPCLLPFLVPPMKRLDFQECLDYLPARLVFRWHYEAKAAL
jgi:hypothetical protein